MILYCESPVVFYIYIEAAGLIFFYYGGIQND